MPKGKVAMDKCAPPGVDMGNAMVFADAIPGMNDLSVRPFGWTEYEASYRPRRSFLPGTTRPGPCRDPCVNRKSVKLVGTRRESSGPCQAPRSDLCSYCQSVKCSCSVPPPWGESKDKVTIVDSDNIRSLLVHGELQNEHPVVLAKGDYCRMMDKVKAKTSSDKEADCLKMVKKVEEDRKLAKMQAEELRAIDQLKFAQSISPEAQAEMSHILCRADRLIKEDEPEVRSINKAILTAKVQAIREAQLVEKELIKSEMAEEERRLAALMEEDANRQEQSFLKAQETEQRIEDEKKRVAREALISQMNEREAAKFIEKERKEAEAAQLKASWSKWREEEALQRALDLERKHKLGVEQLQSLIETNSHKRQVREMERIQELRALEWQMERAAEEERAGRERLAQKNARDIQIQEVVGPQVRQVDEKARRIELRSIRDEEEREREWRRRERVAAEEKHRKMAQLKEGILEQMRTKQRELLEEAEYERRLQERMVRSQGERGGREEGNDEQKLISKAQYRLDLREQIHLDQMRRVKERKDHFVEGVLLRQEAQRREGELKCFLQSKIQEIRDANLPEKFIRNVERAVEEEIKPDWQKKVCPKP